MLDKKNLTDETKDNQQKGRGSANSNYMNIYYNQSGRNSEHKSYAVPSNGIKYENLKKK